MCYYNGVRVGRVEYIRLKHLEKALANYDFLNKPLLIGFDYAEHPVLKRIPDKEDFDIVQMEWGLIPSYLKNKKDVDHFRLGGLNPKTGRMDPPILTLNAVGEEMFQKVTYKNAAAKRRCLVLSTGFFEWRHIFPKNKKTGQPLKTAIKYPYYIHLKDKEYFYMAGIWQPWKDLETGEYLETFAIVTTKANSMMEQVHNSKKRMPSILNEDLAWEWLFGNLDEKRITEIAGTQYPSDGMEVCPISKDFRNSSDPEQPFEYEDLPELALSF